MKRKCSLPRSQHLATGTLSKARWIQTTPYFLNIHFNTILPLFRSSKWSVSFGFPDQNFTTINLTSQLSVYIWVFPLFNQWWCSYYTNYLLLPHLLCKNRAGILYHKLRKIIIHKQNVLGEFWSYTQNSLNEILLVQIDTSKNNNLGCLFLGWYCHAICLDKILKNHDWGHYLTITTGRNPHLTSFRKTSVLSRRPGFKPMCPLSFNKSSPRAFHIWI